MTAALGASLENLGSMIRPRIIGGKRNSGPGASAERSSSARLAALSTTSVRAPRSTIGSGRFAIGSGTRSMRSSDGTEVGSSSTWRVAPSRCTTPMIAAPGCSSGALAPMHARARFGYDRDIKPCDKAAPCHPQGTGASKVNCCECLFRPTAYIRTDGYLPQKL